RAMPVELLNIARHGGYGVERLGILSERRGAQGINRGTILVDVPHEVGELWFKCPPVFLDLASGRPIPRARRTEYMLGTLHAVTPESMRQRCRYRLEVIKRHELVEEQPRLEIPGARLHNRVCGYRHQSDVVDVVPASLVEVANEGERADHV